jgi:hypothetical protein
VNSDHCFVFDTNALVSAALFAQSVPALAFFAASNLEDDNVCAAWSACMASDVRTSLRENG